VAHNQEEPHTIPTTPSSMYLHIIGYRKEKEEGVMKRKGQAIETSLCNPLISNLAVVKINYTK
jgi:hypothetical protein